MSTDLLKYESGILKVLDQQKVTQELKYVEVHQAEDAWTAIRQMHVGSSHLAAIVAALSLAVDVKRHKDNFKYASQTEKYLLQKLEYLRTASPNSKYYGGVIDDLRTAVELSAKEEKATAKHVIILYRAAAEQLWAKEIDAVDRIGKYGAKKILEITGKINVRVLTICNTSMLTSSRYRTALSVVRELHRLRVLEHVYACETRPLNQAGKLTLREISAFEIVYKGLPGSLVTDSAAAYLMATKHVDCVVVGADRVAANGDMCNDFGTYSLAISAMYHTIPFLAAARSTVLDLASSSFSRPDHDDALRAKALSTTTAATNTTTTTTSDVASPTANSGLESPLPLRRFSSSVLELGNPSSPITPPDQPSSAGSSLDTQTPCSEGALPLDLLITPPPSAPTPPRPAPAPSPATVIEHPHVDVTPCSLVTGLVTELGVACRPHSAPASGGGAGGGAASRGGVIDIPAFLRANPEGTHLDAIGTFPDGMATPKGVEAVGYTPFAVDTIAQHVLSLAAVKRLLGARDARHVRVTEVGDGNLNFVYILKGPAGTVVAKQALPYVRCVGASWPLSLDRADFEAAALKAQHQVCPFLVPKVLHFDRGQALIVMQHVPPPHKILRKCFTSGERVGTFAPDVGTFLARTLYHSSALKLDGATFRSRVAEWSRNSLCGLTEQVVFTHPYHAAPLNRHTSPQLDAFVTAIRNDMRLVRGAAVLKSKFMSCAQALVHGDLHTGSVMACEGSTFVIDPEFAFYGPMGFDVGAFLANMLIAYFSCRGHPACGEQYAEWLAEQTVKFHSTMLDTFMELWRDAAASESNGELFSSGPFPSGSDMLAEARDVYLEELWRDTVGFSGVEIIRRVVGIAHVEDLESIADQDIRADCEKRCLLLARQMVLSFYRGSEFTTLAALMEEAARCDVMPLDGVRWPTESAA